MTYYKVLEGGRCFVGTLDKVDVGGWGSETVTHGRGTAAGDGAAVHLGLVGGLVGEQVLLALVLEAGILAHEVQVDGVGGTAAVLGDDELGQAADVVALGVLTRAGIVLGAVDEANDVGILLDSA